MWEGGEQGKKSVHSVSFCTTVCKSKAIYISSFVQVSYAELFQALSLYGEKMNDYTFTASLSGEPECSLCEFAHLNLSDSHMVITSGYLTLSP